VDQLKELWLIHRIREQARSHIFDPVDLQDFGGLTFCTSS
jgi:hypothetical protein